MREAAYSARADDAPRAGFNPGPLLKERGDFDGAKAAHQQAIDSGHADAAPIAADRLAALLNAEEEH
jgi:hypothetical protein